MAQRESRLSSRIIQRLREEWGVKIFVFKVWGNEHQMAGVPDILGCVEGKFFGLETKLPETREDVSARQTYVHRWIQESGGFVRVVTSPAEAVSAVRELLSE
jgi:hypothetical protein